MSRETKYIWIVTILTGSVSAVILAYFLIPTTDLKITLFQQIPNPSTNNMIQILLINNSGKKTATDIIVKIDYVRLVQPIDYKIDALAQIESEIREDRFLKFTVKRLSQNDFVLVSLSSTGGEILPENISIAHDDGSISCREINHVKLDHWR